MFIVKQLPEFTDWFDGRKDSMTRIRLAKRLDKAQRGLQADIAAAIALSKTIQE